MGFNWQDAIQLLIAEQELEAQIKTAPQGQTITLQIPPVVLHIDGKHVELTGLQVKVG